MKPALRKSLGLASHYKCQWNNKEGEAKNGKGSLLQNHPDRKSKSYFLMLVIVSYCASFAPRPESVQIKEYLLASITFQKEAHWSNNSGVAIQQFLNMRNFTNKAVTKSLMTQWTQCCYQSNKECHTCFKQLFYSLCYILLQTLTFHFHGFLSNSGILDTYSQ